ncbi:Mu transposase C-terminal domain-containing protein [Kitasatospora sp. NPDC056531]|uniref:Mu transposase C-terminal domain-containing protein n=1 Tax=Kitasatospora sp. NPDC056531 TaxID=3345856 RepID=UPI0036A85179
MTRLLALDARGELVSAHVRLVASAVGVGERTVWRWLAAARNPAPQTPVAAGRFILDAEVCHLLALWGGNMAAVHRELAARAAADPSLPAPPSLRTLQRAAARDLSAGYRAGLRGGEKARRAHDVFGRRPPTWRNACWEGDHKRVPVQVDVEGELACPWITWFIDCATRAITGVAVTPHAPSRDAVLAALRCAITRTDPYGPIGGLPSLVRVDRGKEFLCATVTQALGAFAVPVQDLPAYTPHLKGTIEALNDAVEEMFLVSLPRYTHRPELLGGRTADPNAAPLTFAAFVELLLAWVSWWNSEHLPSGLGGSTTPLQAWVADPTPIEDVPAEQLATFALEDDGRLRTITTSGVSWRRRPYIAPWMVGHTGTKVRLRYLPHHDEQIEVFDSSGLRHLGSAYLADQATPEQRKALDTTRKARARALKADLKAGERLRRPRYAAVTTATPPERLGALTAAEAEAELAPTRVPDLTARALPDLIPPTEAPASWARPITRPAAPPTATGTHTPSHAHTRDSQVHDADQDE